MKQEFEKYTQEDHDVWNILFTRQNQNLKTKAWSRYLRCIPATGLSNQSVPRFSEIENALARHTGWKIEVVKGIIPVDEFLMLLAQKKFCSSTWLRSRHQLDYLEEPDMFHDVFGHIPLLADERYAGFAERFAKLGLKFLREPVALLLLERLYWFTIEFGLLRESGALKIYGAGILSSFGETNHIFSEKVHLKPFSTGEILRTPFRNNEVQQTYFVAENAAQIWSCLHDTELFIRDVLDGKTGTDTLRLSEQIGSAMASEGFTV